MLFKKSMSLMGVKSIFKYRKISQELMNLLLTRKISSMDSNLKRMELNFHKALYNFDSR